MTSPVNGRKAEASAEAVDEQPNALNPCQASPMTPSDENDNATGSVASISSTVKAPKPPPKIEVNPLASTKKILTAIPETGIHIQKLVKRLKVDRSNFHYFSELCKKIAIFDASGIVKPVASLPPTEELEELEIAAKEPAVPRVLEKNQAVQSFLVGAPVVTWNDSESLIRGAAHILPGKLYRVFHEESATLSAYMTKHNYVKSRELPDLKLHKDAAFQAIGEFSARQDLTRPRIERHLVWNQKTLPSSYISTFDNLKDARRRLKFHSRKGNDMIRQSKRVGERLALAVIDTSNLVPMTVNAKVQEKVITRMTTIKEMLQRSATTQVPGESDWANREVQIPIWVHKSALEGRGKDNSMTLKQLEATKAEMWLSITELRRCNLRVPATRGHHYEWLACGHVPLSSIKKVVPFDGEKLHWDSSGGNIRSSHGEHCWIWDDNKSRWVLDLKWERRKDQERKAKRSGKGLGHRESEDVLSEDDAEFGAFDSDQEIAELSNTDHEQIPANRKRKNVNQEIGHMEKRKRLENDEPFADAPTCTHQCTLWCQLGYTEQEAQYAMAWQNFINPSGFTHDSTASNKEV